MAKRFSLILFSLVFTACGSSSFSSFGKTKGGSPSDPLDASGERNGGRGDDDDADDADNDADNKDPRDNNENLADGQGRAVERFGLASRTGKIDMVWVIDNSGSMGNEAAQVQQNFSSFIASVAKEADIKVALLSAAEGGQGVTLPSFAGRSDQQHAVQVSSTNPLAIAAAATCSAETTTLASRAPQAEAQQSVICSQTIASEEKKEEPTTIFGIPLPNGPYNLVAGIESPRDVEQAKGILSGFFRQDAVPIYVVVSDDDAIGVNQGNFISMVRPHLKGQVPKFFAFRGAANAACDITRAGTSYDTLAVETGGETFDICQASWAPYFSSLTERVVEIASGAFVLPHDDVVRIESVIVDDEWVSPSEYELDGNRLVLRARDRAGAREVEVTYVYEE